MNERERVARGAAWLDEVRPGWFAQIDLALLDLSHGCRCVLGQLYNYYARGCRVFWDRHPEGRAWPSYYGFMADEAAYSVDKAVACMAEFRELDACWVAEINRHRATCAEPAAAAQQDSVADAPRPIRFREFL